MSKSKVQGKAKAQKAKGLGKPAQTGFFGVRPGVLVLIISLVLVVATLAVFWQVRNHTFINYDDNDYVVDNPYVKGGLTLRSVIGAFTATYASNWHPLTWLSHMLDCQLYGLNPGGHHVTSLLFHITNTLLLFLVLRRMTGALWKSGFVAALFALHPLHVESVAWVAERKDVLSTFFWMLTMWAYVRYSKQPSFSSYLLALLSFALGLLSKPMLVTLPFVMLLLDYWPLGRFQFGQGSGHQNPPLQRVSIFYLVMEKVPFFVLSGVSSFLAFFAQQRGGAVGSLKAYALETRMANALISYVRYIERMIWPNRLAVLYPFPEGFHLWEIVGAILLLVCISGLVIRAGRRHPYLGVGWLWYLGTLVPVIGLVQVGIQATADRYTYVPLIGLFIMVAWGFPDLLKAWQYRRIVLSVSAGLLLSVLMIVARLQVYHWENDITIFKHTLDTTSNNFLMHNNLGLTLANQGKVQEAISHYNEALRINPYFARAQCNLGVVLARQGKIEEAMMHYTKALQIDPNYAKAHCNLGVALIRQGKAEEAITHYKEALRIKPDYVEAHYNLGIVLIRQGEIEEAVAHYTEILRIDPQDVEVHNNLGVALARQGKIQEATAHYKEALRARPNYADARYNYGEVLMRQGNIREAILHYTEALRVKPNFSEAHFSLGLAYWKIGNRDSAMEEYRILRAINPDLANTFSRMISR